MPVDYARYPPNWKTKIRPRILERAENCCEVCGEQNYTEHSETGSKVILTIAHLDRDPENWNVTDDRLMAMCQRCHLNYDRADNNYKRKYGKNAGLLDLFTEIETQ